MKILNKTLIYSLIALGLASILGSCKKDIFDKRDLNGVDTTLFHDELSATLYINKAYDLVIPNWPVDNGLHNTTDEKFGANTSLLYGQLTENSVQDIAAQNRQGQNKYFDIRRITLGIEGIERSPGLTAAQKGKLKGQLYFLRAFVYFNLVKLYGGVPLVTKVLDLNKDELDLPRAKTSECIKQIVRDLDSCKGLPATWAPTFNADGGRITLEAARALKGKVLLYWASPQFNPSNDVTRWQEAYAACKDAYTQGVAEGFALIPNYANIFLTEQNNTERIIWRTLDATSINPAKGTNIEANTRPYSETVSGSGSYHPTWNLVKAYPMKDGRPVGVAGSDFAYNELTFWLNRDPRFQASISYNGDIWNLSGKVNRRQWNYTGSLEEKSGPSRTGFYIKRFSNPSLSPSQAVYNSNSAGGNGMDWIEMRFAEVILNYAECANAIGNLSEAKDMVRLIRQRAGIVKGSGAKDYGLELATDVPSMADLIFRERQVEFAMEGKRYDDLRRMRRFHLLSGTIRQGYKWDMRTPAYNTTRPATPNPATLYIEDRQPSGIIPRDTINFANAGSVNKVFIPAVFSIEGTNVINYPETYYFYPLPTNFRTSSVKIEQNIGWPGGTFDPLQ